jgi:hypothetical protein
MEKTDVNNTNWLKSKDVKKELKISDCDLAHIRIAGILGFIKKGNAFIYNSEDVLLYKLKKK